MNEVNSNPVLVEVRRGAIVEARNRGAIVAVESDGRIITQLGNLEMIVSTRSAIKPIQAIPFITSGAADRFQVSGRELAVATGRDAVARRAGSAGTSRIAAISGPATARLSCLHGCRAAALRGGFHSAARVLF